MDNTTFLATSAGLATTMLLAWVIIIAMLPHNVSNRDKDILLGPINAASLLLGFLVVMPLISVGVLFFTLMPLAGAAPPLPPIIVAGVIAGQAFYYAILLMANGLQVIKMQRNGGQKGK